MSATTQFPANALKDVQVLVVDDEEMLAWSIDNELKALGADVRRAGSLREALDRFVTFTPDLVVTDLRLPDGNGLELLKKWRFEYPELPVILITAHGAIDSAVTALRLGACDYLQKPFNMKDLLAAVKRAAEIAKLRQKVSSLQGREATRTEVDIVGDTPSIRVLKEELRRLARSKANTALILGESGTGKELAARAIHEWSERHAQPFVEINCASIPETLLESELFGYEKGAFTDARERKLGLFEIARGGSIFLDEIGEMPLKLQAKLLRVLEYRRFKRLGGTKDIEFTGRIIAATNRDLLVESEERRFRPDLYYRISALPVEIPALRERLEDIGLLTRFFVGQLARELGLKLPRVSPEAVARLKGHDWPGNVRELRNVLQRAMVFFEPEVLEAGHLRLPSGRSRAAATPAAPAGQGTAVTVDSTPATATVPAAASVIALPQPTAPASSPEDKEPAMTCLEGDGNVRLPDAGLSLDTVEKSLLTQALDRARHNQTRAAQLLGISRHTLRYRLEKHGMIEGGTGGDLSAGVAH